MNISERLVTDATPLLGLLKRSLTRVMSAFLEEWGVTLHGLRHSHASHMLTSNIQPKVVQERLGHLIPNMRGMPPTRLTGCFAPP
jgi:integrase